MLLENSRGRERNDDYRKGDSPGSRRKRASAVERADYQHGEMRKGDRASCAGRGKLWEKKKENRLWGRKNLRRKEKKTHSFTGTQNYKEGEQDLVYKKVKGKVAINSDKEKKLPLGGKKKIRRRGGKLVRQERAIPPERD